MTTNKALLIIDVQVGMFNESDPVYQGEILLSKIQGLIEKARSNRIPIFYIQHNEGPGKPLEHGKPGWFIHPSIEPINTDIVIEKKTPDFFNNTTLQQELDNKGVQELIITGIQSEVCVDTTCRRAFSLGYNVTLVKDAHSTWDTKDLTASQIINHHNDMLRWFSTDKYSDEIMF